MTKLCARFGSHRRDLNMKVERSGTLAALDSIVVSPRESARRAPLRFLGSKRVLSRLVAGAARRGGCWQFAAA